MKPKTSKKGLFKKNFNLKLDSDDENTDFLQSNYTKLYELKLKYNLFI